MTVEADIFSTLRDLVNGRVYPDVGPEGAARPYITYQQVGGAAVNFMDQGVPSKKNGRWQINCWAGTRLEAANLARLAADTLRVALVLQTTVLGEPAALYDEQAKLYGTMQDFSFWFDT